jgi:N utilization substance protein A
MNYNLMDALSQIIKEKRVDKGTLIDTIKMSIASAARRKIGSDAEIDVHIDEAKGNLTVSRVYRVVEEVNDEAVEMSLDKAKKLDPGVEVGGEIREELQVADFGRNAIQTAKQVLTQKVREAERDRVYQDYKNKVGVIISGTVRQVDRGNILVNIGKAEAYLPKREQIRTERYNQGDTIRACIIEVDKNTRGPQIIISRTDETFLRKLFEQEVPEIFDGEVEIKSIAREPGSRSKIAVNSRSEKVDAVGSCVGMKGSRVQAVVNELQGEKIDIVNWSENSSEFVERALAPAKISSLRFNEAHKEVVAVVEDDQLSLAIGKEGQNVRLASNLTGWKIDLMSVKEAEARSELEQELQMDISEMFGVSEKMAKKLINIGVFTVQRLHRTPKEELLNVDGIGEKTADKLKATARETMEELDKAMEKLLEEKMKVMESEKQLFDEEFLGEETEEKEKELTERDIFGKVEEGVTEKKDESEERDLEEKEPEETSLSEQPENFSGSDSDTEGESDEEENEDMNDSDSPDEKEVEKE